MELVRADRDVARQVQQIYEDHPYPAVGPSPPRRFWCLPPLKWINDVWRPSTPFPARILSAGCGTGNEVFAFRHRFPGSEIVGLDFCAKSIRIARGLQRRKRLSGIRFLVGDLGDKELPRRIGGQFDFISCHGVLAYVPRCEVALQNFAALLRPDGALYLGVNGAGHFSPRWRQALPELGFDPTKPMADDPALPKAIALLEALSGDGVAPVARQEASFLPTDLFGPLIRNTSLKDLLRECRRSGLHFLGVHDHPAPFRATVNDESYLTLLPRSRAAVAQLIDAIRPAGFHRLLLSRRAAANPPWDNPDALAGWRPVLAPHLRKQPLPIRRGPWNKIRAFEIKSRVTNTALDLRTTEQVWEVLRQSRGEKSLQTILAQSGGTIRNPTLRKHLYLLHQLYFLNFNPPAAS